MKTYVGLAGRTLIPRISVAARAGKLLIFTFPGTYRKPTPWLGEKRRFCYFHLLKGIKIGEKRGKSYVGPFRGFLIKPVIGEILFLGSDSLPFLRNSQFIKIHKNSNLFLWRPPLAFTIIQIFIQENMRIIFYIGQICLCFLLLHHLNSLNMIMIKSSLLCSRCRFLVPLEWLSLLISWINRFIPTLP